MSFFGFVSAAAQLGLTSLAIKPIRGILVPGSTTDGRVTITPIFAQAVIEEKHLDEMEITEHPIEFGSVISDHAFKRPAELIIKMAWSNSPNSQGSLLDAATGAVAANSSAARIGLTAIKGAGAILSVLSNNGSDRLTKTYNQLLQLQESRTPFNIFTGKRKYENMLCRTLTTETESSLENVLLVIMECQQIIIVNSNAVSLKKQTQKNARSTASPSWLGQIQPVIVK